MIVYKSVIIALIFFIYLPIEGVTYHVTPSPSGNDASSGSQNLPWATLQHAADNIKAGDSVIVHAGTYKGFVLGWDSEGSGTKEHRVVFSAETGVIIDEKNNKTADAINLEGASWVTIDGFAVKNTKGTITRAGIRAVTDTGVIIRNNTIDSCGTWGIFTGFSESVCIENNSASRSIKEHGIYFSNSADNPVIRGNRSYSNNGCGIHMNGDESMGGDGIISHALAENNIVWENGHAGGSGINCDGVQNSRIQNNVLYNNHASGISLFQGNAAEPAKNDTIVNNTIIEASDARWCINIKNVSTGSNVINNILYNYHSSRGSISIDQESMSGLKSDYNVIMDRLSPDDDNTVMSLVQWKSATNQDNHSLIATPAQLFIDATGNNFHCKPGSPAIDAGTELFAPIKDNTGISRPRNSKFDAGAYEYSPDTKIVPFTWHENTSVHNKKSTEKTISVDLAGRILKDQISIEKNHIFLYVKTKSIR
jgi:parallel beta-helix repeat protein